MPENYANVAGNCQNVLEYRGKDNQEHSKVTNLDEQWRILLSESLEKKASDDADNS